MTDQQMSDDQRWVELSIPGAETGVVLFTPKGQEDRIGTFLNTSWEVDHVEKTYAELQARRGVPRTAAKAALGNLRDDEGLGRQSDCPVLR